MKTIRDERHAVEIEHVSIHEGRLEELEVSIVHPDGCNFDNCPLVYMTECIGTDEALNLKYWSGKPNGYAWDDPTWDLLRAAFTTSRGVVPIRFEFHYGERQYGLDGTEYDEELWWWPR